MRGATTSAGFAPSQKFIHPPVKGTSKRRGGKRRITSRAFRPVSTFKAMPKCETCGNDYDKAFTVVMNNESHVFDSFECAAHRLAPTCEHCGCRVLGHGVESSLGKIFCCVHCAEHAGETGFRDRA